MSQIVIKGTKLTRQKNLAIYAHKPRKSDFLYHFLPNFSQIFDFFCSFPFSIGQENISRAVVCLSAVQDMPLTPATINPEQLHEKLPAGLLKSGNG